MRISLTEQQARSLAAAARAGLEVARANGLPIRGIESMGDEQSAYAAADILDGAWQRSVNHTEQEMVESTDG